MATMPASRSLAGEPEIDVVHAHGHRPGEGEHGGDLQPLAGAVLNANRKRRQDVPDEVGQQRDDAGLNAVAREDAAPGHREPQHQKRQRVEGAQVHEAR